ncbi:unnamed protein product [Rotaria sordida]|uniref:Uncharacterized protein n=1 Tax=Rotaria sordida TaxID=392033 RepID=A0A814CU27_9BILA|nr:unnamed protein product [Rotaria sordida]
MNVRHRLSTVSQIHLPYGDEYCSQERVALAGSDFQRQLVFSRVEDSARPVNQRRLSVISEIYYPIEHEESRHESTINEAPVQAESNKRRRQILFIAEPIIVSLILLPTVALLCGCG